MIKNSLLKIGFLVVLLTLPLAVLAEDLNSSSYQIQDFSVGSLGQDIAGTNYSLLISASEVTADARFTGTNYSLEFGGANTWKANVPKILCFEASSDGSTACEDPDIAGGMVQICGGGGCHNRARFEINPVGNAPDTLYSIQITTDPTWNTFDFIDGPTMLIEPVGNHNINDYLSESAWEGTTSSINIFGLESQLTYYLRATALHGNFTETPAGPPSVTTITVPLPQISVDYDISDSGGATVETTNPYIIELAGLLTGSVTTSPNLIWLDIDSNVNSGAKMYVRGVNQGLYSATESFLIPSANADLASIPGFGLQNDYSNQTFLGNLLPTVDFNGTGDQVGGVPLTSFSKELLTTNSAPIYQGRAGFLVKARPPEGTPDAIDFTETFIFTTSADF